MWVVEKRQLQEDPQNGGHPWCLKPDAHIGGSMGPGPGPLPHQPPLAASSPRQCPPLRLRSMVSEEAELKEREVPGGPWEGEKPVAPHPL